MPADDEGTPDQREVSRQALRHPVDEIPLVRIAADIGEGQHDQGKARRLGFLDLRRPAYRDTGSLWRLDLR